MRCWELREDRMWPWLAVLYLLGNTDLVWNFPITPQPRISPEDFQFAEEYLRRFYHLVEDGSQRSRRDTAGAFQRKIIQMQEFFGLEGTGHLDQQTLAEMKKARCGVPDVENYTFHPDRTKWRNHTITYRIEKYTPDLRREQVETTIQKALKMWSDAAPLSFLKVDRGKADIMMSFSSGDHGDFFPFDGPRGVLAHAFEPGEDMGGDIHFDEDEIWTAGQHTYGYNLFTVAAHELGHALGLGHSRDPSALMYPSYKYNDMVHYALPIDDALGIQALYGPPRPRKQQTTAPPDKCDPNLSFDAVALIGQERVFFKNRYVWLRTTWAGQRNKLRQGPSTTFLPGIISPVDAAYSLPSKGVAYIFTGPKYWVVQQLSVKNHYSSIYDFGFPTRVKKIDAAVHMEEFGKTYFFVGGVYYRFDENKSAMDPGFPKSIHSNWPGIGGKIDAAFELAGYIHLFCGTKAYKYDIKKRRVVYTVKANAWLGC